MSIDRGDFRAIRRALIDGPDFQRLTRDARMVLVFAKINAGPAGIEVEYEGGFVQKLSHQTGIRGDFVQKALHLLEKDGWTSREGNVIWIVGHLTFEPSLRASDPKHRKGVQRYVAGLPRLEIVRRYVAWHPEWFPHAELEGAGLGWVLGRVSGESRGESSIPKPKPKPKQINNKETLPETPAPVPAVPPAAADVIPTADKRSDEQPLPLLSAFGLSLTSAANAAVTERWGEQTRPYFYGQTAELAAKLVERDVSLETAMRAIVQVCRDRKGGPPTSINYFEKPILDLHEQEEQRAIDKATPVTLPKAVASNGRPTPLGDLVRTFTAPDSATTTARQDRDRRENDLRAEYERARLTHVRAWSEIPENVMLYRGCVTLANEKHKLVLGTRFGDKARDVEILQLAGEKSGFPPFEQWQPAATSERMKSAGEVAS